MLILGTVRRVGLSIIRQILPVLAVLATILILVYAGYQLFGLRDLNELSYGKRSAYVSSAPATTPRLLNCQGRVVSGVTLLLQRCNLPIFPRSKAYVVTLPVRLPPGEAAQKALSNVIAKGSISCEANRRCLLDQNDLGVTLLEAGLAAIESDPTQAERDAQERAKSMRRGIWWDWDETQEPSHERELLGHATPDIRDPIVWRGERDASLPGLTANHLARSSAIASYVTGILSFVLGGVFFQYLFGISSQEKKNLQTATILKKMTKDIYEDFASLFKGLSKPTAKTQPASNRALKIRAALTELIEYTKANVGQGTDLFAMSTAFTAYATILLRDIENLLPQNGAEASLVSPPQIASAADLQSRNLEHLRTLFPRA